MDDTSIQFRLRMAQINGIKLHEAEKKSTESLARQALDQAIIRPDPMARTAVIKKNGDVKTIHMGNSFSIPLHPEHQEEISTLKNGQRHEFTDETNTKWIVHREGDNVHFNHKIYKNLKATVKHSEI